MNLKLSHFCTLLLMIYTKSSCMHTQLQADQKNETHAWSEKHSINLTGRWNQTFGLHWAQSLHWPSQLAAHSLRSQSANETVDATYSGRFSVLATHIRDNADLTPLLSIRKKLYMKNLCTIRESVECTSPNLKSDEWRTQTGFPIRWTLQMDGNMERGHCLLTNHGRWRAREDALVN